MSQFDGKEKRTPVIYIFIFVLLAAGISAGGYLSYRNFEQQFRTQAEHQLSSIAELKVNELVNWQMERIADAEMLHQNPVFTTLVQAYFENPQEPSAQAQIQAWLEEYQIYPDYDRVRLLDPQGQTRLSDPVGLPPISSAVAKRIPEVLQSKQVTLVDFYHRDIDGQISLSLLVPIADARTDQVIGLVTLSINPETYLYPFIQSWPTLSPTAETLLVRREGNDVLFLNDLRFQPDAALNLRYPLTETELPAAKAVLGPTGAVDGVDYRGEPVLADVRAVPDSPWFLVSKMDIAEVYAPLRARLWQTLGLVGAAIFVAGMGLVAVWRQQRVLFYRAQAEAADALRESEKKYQVLTEISPVGIFKTDAQGTTTYVNPHWSQISGLSADEALGDGWLRAVHPEDRENLSASWKKATSTQISSVIEYRFVHPDGSIAWILGQSTPERNIQNRIVGYVGTITDITERKQAEEALKKSETWFRSLFEKASDGIFYLSGNGMVVTVNDSFARMHGYSVEEMRKMDMKDLDTPDTTRQFAERMRRIMAGEIFTFEVEHYHKDGHTFPLEVTASVITVGEEKYVLAFHRDITERKQAEDLLIKSETTLRKVQEIARIGNWEINLVTRMVTASEEAHQIYGISQEAMPLADVQLAPLPEFRPMLDAALAALVTEGKRYDVEFKIQRQTDGLIRYVHSMAEYNAASHVIVGSLQDITERKQAEDALRDRQAQVTGILNSAMDAIITVDEEQKIIIFNPSAEQMFGCLASEAIGQTLERFLPEHVRKEHSEYMRVFGQSNLTKRSMKTPALALTCLRADGEAFPSEVSISQLEIGGQKLYTAIVRDITERKQAEERLAASEVRYRRLFEAARDGILILNAESGVVMEVNPFLVEMLGFPKEEIVGKELWELGFFKDVAANKANFLELQQKDYIRYEDLPMETVNGRKFHVEFVSNVYQVNHHKVVQCNIRDITERKQAEDMVRAHLRLTEFAGKHSLDELLQRTLDEVCAITNSPIGFYHFVKPDQKTLSLQAWSTRTLEEYCKAEGKGLHYDVEEAGVWVECIRQRQPVIHNDYASLPASSRKGLPEGHAALTRELVVPIMRDGLIVAILGIGNKAQDYVEKDIDTVAYFADVAWETAERKRAEQTLATYTEKLEEIVDERTHELRNIQEQLVRQERLATLGQLAGSIGHELRNPLGVISNAVYFLKMSQPDANNTVKEYLDIIENETRTSDKIVTDLLDFTRIKSVDIQPVAVAELIRQTLERYPAPPSVEVSVEIAPDLPLVYADPQHILQVLGNLTVNACQAMSEGGKLSLYARPQDDMMVIAVQDSGEGIPPENMKKLFEPLFTTKTKGIGLGLAVSQKLAEANGGRIEVQSEPGKGSTFTLSLPIFDVNAVPGSANRPESLTGRDKESK